MYWPNFKSVAFPVPEIIGGTQTNLDSPWICPPFLFSKTVQAFDRMDPVIVVAKFEVRSFTRSRDNSDWSFIWGGNPNHGEAEAVGGWDGNVRKSVGEFL